MSFVLTPKTETLKKNSEILWLKPAIMYWLYNELAQKTLSKAYNKVFSPNSLSYMTNWHIRDIWVYSDIKEILEIFLDIFLSNIL